jgi:hypothetical protein
MVVIPPHPQTDAYISKLQNRFLDKYNPHRSIDVAATNSIRAAVQRNTLYAKEVPFAAKKAIYQAWITLLSEKRAAFKEFVSIPQYEESVLSIRQKMNSEFGEFFCSDIKSGNGMRISHAQKSLSLFVKYLWCLGEIPEPEVCPVDRQILTKTEAKEKRDLSWGYVNTIEDHQREFKYISDAAKISRHDSSKVGTLKLRLG